MTTKTFDKRAWALIAVSFVLGMMAAEFIDLHWQSTVDGSPAVVAHETVVHQ